ncbi:MAG: OmpH family outer membrane protein [Nitrospinae bacterium]|nr:OmpH family outer membrane protein [Nitrospinota bacterium]
MKRVINTKSFRTTAIIIAILSGIYIGKIKRSIADAHVLKIGYIDVQKVITDSEAGEKALRYLQGEYEGKGEIIKKKKANLKELSEEISKLTTVMDKEVKISKEKEYQEAEKDLKRFIEDSNQKLVDKEKEISEKMASQIIGLVQDIGKDEGYTMIFDNSKIIGIIAYASDEIDLTEEIMRRYNHL